MHTYYTTLPILLILGALSARKSVYLIAIWIFVYMANPTLRVMVGPAPVYWSDIITVFVIASFLRQRPVAGDISRVFNIWFIVLSLSMVTGIMAGLLRFGDVIKPTYEYLRHFFALAPLLIIPKIWNTKYMRGVIMGAAISGIVIGAVALAQTVSKETAAVVEQLYYGDYANVAIAGYDSVRERIIFVSDVLRVYGMYSTATAFGGTCVLILICLLNFQQLLQKSFLKRLAWVAAIGAGIAALLTYSRHALLALGFFLAWYFITLKRGRLKFLILAPVIVVVGLQFVSLNFWESRIQKGGVTNDQNLRLRLIQRPLELLDRIAADPLLVVIGAGFGINRIEGVDRKEANYGFASNGFLLSLFYCGAFALISILAFYGYAFVRAWRSAGERFSIGVPSVFCAVLITASDNYTFLIPNVPFIISLIMTTVVLNSVQPARNQVSKALGKFGAAQHRNFRLAGPSRLPKTC